jgi:hypothetical protein
MPLRDALQALPPPGGLPDHPPATLDGYLRITRGRLGNTRWRYRVVNGTHEAVSSVHLVLPARFYDSRITPTLPYFGLPPLRGESALWPFGPYTWTTRRDRGEGAYQGKWIVSWLATDPNNLLPSGRAMQVDLQSSAAMTESHHYAVMLCASSRRERLQLPWDDEFARTLLAPAQPGHPDIVDWQAPFPVFSNNELQVNEHTFQEVEQRFDASFDIWSTGLRFGDQYTLTVKTRRPVVANLARGSVLLPSSPDYDVLINGRDERLSMNLGEQATISLRAFSLTYGRKAMPKRYDTSSLGYRLDHPKPEGAAPLDLKRPAGSGSLSSEVGTAPEAALDARHLDAAREVLRRAEHLRPVLTTALGARYEDYLVQWGLWRKLQILDGQPLRLRDLEQSLALHFVPLAQGKKQYLTPVQIVEIAKLLWSDTEALLYDEPPTQPLTP